MAIDGLTEAYKQTQTFARRHSESANIHQSYAIFPLCSPGGSTVFGEDLLYLATVKNPSILSWIQVLIQITTKI